MISDFSDSDYATAAQGALAATAVQPGANISSFTNDAGYITSVPSSALNDLTDVSTAGATAGQVLKFNGTQWVAQNDLTGAGGETNTASNIGGGAGIFASKVGEDLQFKSLVAGTGVTITNDANTITINSSATGGASLTNPVTTGAEMIIDPLADPIQIRRVVAGNTSLTVTQNAENVSFAVNASNSSTSGEGILRGITPNGLEFKRIQAGANITLSSSSEGIVINSTATGGASSLDALSDVTITSAAANNALFYNGTQWVNRAIAKADITDFDDADYATAAQGALAATAVQPGANISSFVNDAGYITSVPSSALNDLTDVSTAGATPGQVLKFNGTGWAPADDLSGTGSSSTNLGVANITASTLEVTSDTGTNATLPAASTTTAGLMTSTDKSKLDSIPANAAPDQNVFTQISLGGNASGDTTISANSTTDTLNIVAGTNISIVGNASGDTVTINATSTGGATSLDALSDVDTTTTPPTDGQVLAFNNAIGQWLPTTIASGGSGPRYEWVVLQYRAGDTINPATTQTSSGVTVSSYDASAANLTGFQFTGYNLPPSAVTVYAQNVAVGFWEATNLSDFINNPLRVTDANGGTSNPDLINVNTPFTGTVSFGLPITETAASNKSGLPTIFAKLFILFTMVG